MQVSNATHCLLAIGNDMMPFTEMCNVTHNLLVIGEDVMRLIFIK